MVSGKTTVREAVERLVAATETQHNEITSLYKTVDFLKKIVVLYVFLLIVIMGILIKILI